MRYCEEYRDAEDITPTAHKFLFRKKKQTLQRGKGLILYF